MAESPAPAPRYLGQIALGVFLSLLVFGLVLLFNPDLANDLDDRSAGGRAGDPQGLTITEEKRTTEETSRGERGSASTKRSRRASNDDGKRGRGRTGGRGGSKTSESSTTDETTTTETETTTTTETVSPAPEQGGVFAEVFSVPALIVLARCVGVALLAGLAALPLLWGLRRARSRGGAVPGESAPAATENPTKTPAGDRPGPEPPRAAVVRPAPPKPPSGPNGRPFVDSSKGDGHSPAPPMRPAVTRADAEGAKARIMGGIPLLREIFEARGEPDIASTLPDMRVRVNLTETITKEQPLPVSMRAADPALALATFRTEVEQRLRRLARDAVAQCADSTDSILQSLTEEGLFDAQAAEGMRNLLRMADHAVHGAAVDPEIGAWVREDGVSLLLSLDLMLPS